MARTVTVEITESGGVQQVSCSGGLSPRELRMVAEQVEHGADWMDEQGAGKIEVPIERITAVAARKPTPSGVGGSAYATQHNPPTTALPTLRRH